MTSIPFVPLLALGTLVFTFTNVLKFASGRNWNAVVTQLVAWASGVGAVFLVGSTQFAAGVGVGATTLDRLDGPSKLVLGLLATSLLSTLNEVKKALDGTDSAATPPLLPTAPATLVVEEPAPVAPAPARATRARKR